MRKNSRLFRRGSALLMAGLLACSSVGTAITAYAEESTESYAIVNLTTEGLENPIGIDTTTPTFSWEMDSDVTGAEQTAYRIVVKNASGTVMWDSGTVESGESANIEYEGTALSATTEYYWYVTVTDEKGDKHTSETNTFETSFLDTTYDSWDGAEWIGGSEDNLDAASSSLFDMSMTVTIPEGSTKASVILGADDYRLETASMNIWNTASEVNYFQYEIDISDPDNPVLNIYVVGMPAYGSDEENSADEPDYTVDLSSYLNSDSLHEAMTVRIWTPSEQSQISCSINGTTVDSNRQLNPMGNTHDYVSFPNLNSIGFAAAAGETAEYTDVNVYNYNTDQEKVLFGYETGATYSIFEGLEGVTVSGSEDLITVEGGEDGVIVYADPSYGSSPMVRTEFTAEGMIAEARLYVTSQGIYDFYVNGELVEDSYFNPGSEEYSTYFSYQCYDITDLLNSNDENAVGAQLGQGWWSDETTYTSSAYDYYGEEQALMAKIVITYADGSTETIVTDTDTWQVSTSGPVEYASFYHGERYNAQTAAEYEGWSTTEYEVTDDWETPTVITPQYNDFDFVVRFDEAVTVVNELSVVEALGESYEGSGSYIYDMGENVAGVAEIYIPEEYVEEGATVTIRYAEVLYPDLEEYQEDDLVGQLMTENLRAALCTDFYTATSGDQTFSPRYTYHGYRYIEITGLKEELPAEYIKTLVLSSVETTSTYDSSNSLVNRLFENVQNSQTSNFISLPTDCPQRNERLGWTGDAQVFSLAASYNADVYNFYRNWLKSLRACQREDGSLPVYAPDYDTLSSGGFSGTSWDAAIAVIPYNMYTQYGNDVIIEENIEAIDDYLDYCAANDMSTEYPALTSTTGMLADWLSVDDTDSALINNAVYVYMMGITAEMAEVIGRDDLVEKYTAMYEEAKQQWNDCYVEEGTGRMYATSTSWWTGEETTSYYDTEAAYATPLMYGVVSDENIELCVENYVQTVIDADYTITSGFSGTPNLVPVLTMYGYWDEAYELFEQTEYASWLYPVTQGATSVWERWNSYTLDGGFNGNNSMNSFNHFSLGAITSWMMQYQLGIDTGDEAGYKSFVLQPVVGGTFTYANGTYESNYGTIYSGWTADGEGNIETYAATVPANTTATLYLPISETQALATAVPEGAEYIGQEVHNGKDCAVYTLTSGSYSFTIVSEEDALAAEKEEALAAADAALAALADYQSADSISEENLTAVEELIAAAEAAVEAYLALEGSTDDLTGYANIAGAQAAVEAYKQAVLDAEALAAAKEAAEEAILALADYQEEGSVTEDNYLDVKALLAAAESAAEAYTELGGSTEDLENYGYIEGTEAVLAAFEETLSEEQMLAFAKIAAETALAGLEGYQETGSVTADNYETVLSLIDTAQAAVEVYIALEGSTDDLSGYENLEGAKAAVAAYEETLAEAKAAAEDALAALAQYQEEGSVTAENYETVLSLYKAAQEAVQAYADLGGSTDDLSGYANLSGTQEVLEAYEDSLAQDDGEEEGDADTDTDTGTDDSDTGNGDSGSTGDDGSGNGTTEDTDDTDTSDDADDADTSDDADDADTSDDTDDSTGTGSSSSDSSSSDSSSATQTGDTSQAGAYVILFGCAAAVAAAALIRRRRTVMK